ncbi:hypothetical protein LTR37_002675 [Vermiconidia calcicola]|uniref:Uncharacterized protein n=1 Tax=Vermiconidia calcicola TaxID=1690605 RepID=A0ACC3NT83_9PEZI|nr:hypothetical protein LTR37_002675 [Vermiconidia calcicola]
MAASGPKSTRKVIEDYLDASKAAKHKGGNTYGRTAFLDAHTENINRKEVLILLKDAQEAETAVHKFINNGIGGDPLKTAPSDRSARAAAKVFDIPELAEMVFSMLSVKDPISATWAIDSWCDSIQLSRKLQVKLGHQGDANSFWTSVFSDECAGVDRPNQFLSCYVNKKGHYSSLGPNEVEVSATFTDQYHREYRGRPDRHRRSILICQPPVQQMQVTASCCSREHTKERAVSRGLPPPPAPTVIRSTTGLTLGDILDAEDKMMRDHASCPYASAYLLDYQNGLVRLDVNFQGVLLLRSDDPALPSAALEPDYDYGYHSDPDPGLSYEDRAEERMGGFIEAKETALLSNLPIPTLAEYRAANPSNSGMIDGNDRDHLGRPLPNDRW